MCIRDRLITSDLGVTAASEMTRNLAAKKFNRDVNEEDIRVSFASDIANILQPFAKPIKIDPSLKPHIVLVCGVNGSGKTTTIGKLAQQWADGGKKYAWPQAIHLERLRWNNYKFGDNEPGCRLSRIPKEAIQLL